MTMTSDRDLRVDAMRALAILAVVGIHSVPLAHPLLLASHQLLNFAVGMFIFLAGYLNSKPRSGYVDILRRRVIRIGVPYILWSAFFLVWAGVTKPTVWIIALVTGQAVAPYYFVIVILQFYVILPLLWHLHERLGSAGLLAVSIAVTTLTLGAWYGFSIAGLKVPFPYYALPFSGWLVYFALGLWIGRITPKPLAPYVRLIGFATLVSGSLSITEAFVLGDLSFAGSQLKLSSVLYGCFFCLWTVAMPLPRTATSSPVVWLGQRSFGVYLIHIPVLWAFRHVTLSLVDGTYVGALFAIVIRWVGTIACCCAIIAVGRRILPGRTARLIVGFG